MTGTGKKIIKETNAAADHVTSEAAAAGKDATRKLARFAAAVRYDDLPKPLVKLMKQCVLDTLGLCIGATTLAPEAKIIASYVKAMGGHAQSSILGFGGKAPAAWAAFINGSLAHMLDYDSTGDGGHTSVATIPVAFAMAEKSGGVSGRDLIAALACGADIHTRLAQSVDIQEWAMVEGWLPTQLLGYVSGAATAGRVLGLDERQMENALGMKAKKILAPIETGDVPETYADVDALTEAVNFRPATPLAVGVGRFIDWYRAYTNR